MKSAITIVVAAALLGLALPTEAGWWIFGKGKGEVEFRYLQINGVAFEETEGSVAFTRDLLADGMLLIRGKARAGRGQIGAVEVSLDDQATWQSAEVATDGTFSFSWRPVVGTKYTVLVKAMTTTGQTNPVEETRLEVRLLEQDLRALIVAALQRLVDAYQNEDAAAFMANVSANFAGDSVILDRAVRDDFSLFDNIRIGFTLNNLAVGQRGRILVGISYRRSLVAVRASDPGRSGQVITDQAQTEFTFVQEDGSAKVWAMKIPLIFGVTDATEVATGTVSQSGDTEVIVVNDQGQAQTVPVSQAGQEIAGSESGEFTLGNEEGWNFAMDDYAPALQFNQMDVNLHAWQPTDGMLMFHPPGGVDLGVGTINDFNEAPETGNQVPEAQLPGAVGHVYAMKTIDNKYALVEVVSFAGGKVRCRFKYQPNGTRFF